MDRAVMADEIEDRAMQWLWNGYMPLGELVVIDGDPSMGKSNVTIDIVARVTSGGLMPDGSKGAYGNVMVLSPENGDTRLKARLRAAGADLSKVRVLPPGWTLPSNTADIEVYMRQDRSKVLVLDPYAHILSPNFRMNNDQQVRAAFKDLLIAAHKYGCTIILVRHLKKGADCPVLHRGEGTIGLIAMARAGYIVGQDPDNLSRRLMAVTKLNDGPEPDTMAFFNKSSYDRGIQDTAPHIQWDGTSPCTKDQLILSAKGEKNVNRNNRVVRFLLEVLNDGPKLSKDVLIQAKERGISPSALSIGRTDLGVERKKNGTQWVMWLPGNEAEFSSDKPKKMLKRDLDGMVRSGSADRSDGAERGRGSTGRTQVGTSRRSNASVVNRTAGIPGHRPAVKEAPQKPRKALRKADPMLTPKKLLKRPQKPAEAVAEPIAAGLKTAKSRKYVSRMLQVTGYRFKPELERFWNGGRTDLDGIRDVSAVELKDWLDNEVITQEQFNKLKTRRR